MHTNLLFVIRNVATRVELAEAEKGIQVKRFFLFCLSDLDKRPYPVLTPSPSNPYWRPSHIFIRSNVMSV